MERTAAGRRRVGDRGRGVRLWFEHGAGVGVLVGDGVVGGGVHKMARGALVKRQCSLLCVEINFS
jgi:hypothetical protein